MRACRARPQRIHPTLPPRLLAGLHQGAGRVNERVWESIPQEEEIAEWTGEPPTKQELRRAYNAMKLGKAGGEDEVVAEYLRYGGAALRDRIYEVVIDAWCKASSAEAGQEAGGWPAEWRIGLVAPLWKKEGKMF